MCLDPLLSALTLWAKHRIWLEMGGGGGMGGTGTPISSSLKEVGLSFFFFFILIVSSSFD